jgi:hypothetical protein
MGCFDRGVEPARSLAIYHAMPLRQRRLRRLYDNFVGAGDLVFDIGAMRGIVCAGSHPWGMGHLSRSKAPWSTVQGRYFALWRWPNWPRRLSNITSHKDERLAHGILRPYVV